MVGVHHKLRHQRISSENWFTVRYCKIQIHIRDVSLQMFFLIVEVRQHLVPFMHSLSLQDLPAAQQKSVDVQPTRTRYTFQAWQCSDISLELQSACLCLPCVRKSVVILDQTWWRPWCWWWRWRWRWRWWWWWWSSSSWYNMIQHCHALFMLYRDTWLCIMIQHCPCYIIIHDKPFYMIRHDTLW